MSSFFPGQSRFLAKIWKMSRFTICPVFVQFFVQVLDFTCPGMSSFFGQKMENVHVFGKTHLVTLDYTVVALASSTVSKSPHGLFALRRTLEGVYCIISHL